MRKGALNRFSIVVVSISVAAMIPVGFFHYKNTAPTSYICTDTLSPEGLLHCYPENTVKYVVTEKLSYDHPSYINRFIGNSPMFHISSRYLSEHYKYVIDNDLQNIYFSKELADEESSRLRKEIKEWSDGLKPIEERYLHNTLGLTISTCLILPLLTLAVLYTLRFLGMFVIHGRRKTATPQT